MAVEVDGWEVGGRAGEPGRGRALLLFGAALLHASNASLLFPSGWHIAWSAAGAIDEEEGAGPLCSRSIGRPLPNDPFCACICRYGKPEYPGGAKVVDVVGRGCTDVCVICAVMAPDMKRLGFHNGG